MKLPWEGSDWDNGYRAGRKEGLGEASDYLYNLIRVAYKVSQRDPGSTDTAGLHYAMRLIEKTRKKLY